MTYPAQRLPARRRLPYLKRWDSAHLEASVQVLRPLGQRLKEIRQARGLSATDLQIPHATMDRCERGVGSFAALVGYAKALGFDVQLSYRRAGLVIGSGGAPSEDPCAPSR